MDGQKSEKKERENMRNKKVPPPLPNYDSFSTIFFRLRSSSKVEKDANEVAAMATKQATCQAARNETYDVEQLQTVNEVHYGPAQTTSSCFSQRCDTNKRRTDLGDSGRKSRRAAVMRSKRWWRSGLIELHRLASFQIWNLYSICFTRC